MTVSYCLRWNDLRKKPMNPEMGWRSFRPDGQIGLVETHRFLPEEGLIVITRYNPTTENEQISKQNLVDTTPLTEPVPSFGDYDSITRYER